MSAENGVGPGDVEDDQLPDCDIGLTRAGEVSSVQWFIARINQWRIKVEYDATNCLWVPVAVLQLKPRSSFLATMISDHQYMRWIPVKTVGARKRWRLDVDDDDGVLEDEDLLRLLNSGKFLDQIPPDCASLPLNDTGATAAESSTVSTRRIRGREDRFTTAVLEELQSLLMEIEGDNSLSEGEVQFRMTAFHRMRELLSGVNMNDDTPVVVRARERIAAFGKDQENMERILQQLITQGRVDTEELTDCLARSKALFGETMSPSQEDLMGKVTKLRDTVQLSLSPCPPLPSLDDLCPAHRNVRRNFVSVYTLLKE